MNTKRPVVHPGEQYGRLQIISECGRTPRGQRTFLCRCSCDRTVVVASSNLRTGNTTSCGCAKIDATIVRFTKHGHKRKGQKSIEYAAWCSMLARCYNKHTKRWGEWGGRGIVVCDEWRASFQSFYEYVGPKTSPKHSLDRINNSGNYEPGNVRWATHSEQQKNRRPFHAT